MKLKHKIISLGTMLASLASLPAMLVSCTAPVSYQMLENYKQEMKSLVTVIHRQQQDIANLTTEINNMRDQVTKWRDDLNNHRDAEENFNSLVEYYKNLKKREVMIIDNQNVSIEEIPAEKLIYNKKNYQDNTKKILEVIEQYSQKVQTYISHLKAQIATLRERVAVLEAKINKLESIIDWAREDIKGITAWIKEQDTLFENLTENKKQENPDRALVSDYLLKNHNWGTIFKRISLDENNPFKTKTLQQIREIIKDKTNDELLSYFPELNPWKLVSMSKITLRYSVDITETRGIKIKIGVSAQEKNTFTHDKYYYLIDKGFKINP